MCGNFKLIFIFLDGFGIGEKNNTKNPIYAADTPNLDFLFNKCLVFETDASLGVPGLPQSATGQTSIFTGVNAQLMIGRHLNAQPTINLRKLINRDNLFKQLIGRGIKVTNANVYRQEYLDRMNDPMDKRHKPSVTSVMTMSAGIPFRKVEDYRSGKGIYHDITGQIIVESGYEAEIITPQEAARRLYNLSRDFDFTLYEHFMTDIIGHKMDMTLAIKEIELLDTFLGGMLKLMDPARDVLLITSDHGNIEDISVKTHTMNKVPTFIYGNLPDNAGLEIHSLLDITPTVLKFFEMRGVWD